MHRGQPLRITGTIENRSGHTWTLRHDDPEPLRLGGQIRPDGADATPPLEIRGVIRAAKLRAGEAASFEVTVSTRRLAEGRHILELGLLRENAFWFSSRGARGVQQEFEVAVAQPGARHAWMEAMEAAVDAVRPERTREKDFALLAQLLSEFDFSNHPFVLRLRQPDAVNHSENPAAVQASGTSGSASTVMRTLNAPVAIRNDVGIPISRFMLHLRSVMRLEKAWPLHSAQSQMGFVRWYVEEAASELGFGVPIGSALIAFLNADAYPTWIQPLRLSRFMFANLHNLEREIQFHRDQSVDHVGWWFANFLAKRGLDPRLLPSYVIGALTTPDTAAATAASASSAPIPSRYFARSHKTDAQLQALYDLADPVALSAFTFDTLLANIADPIRSRLIGEGTRAWFRAAVQDDPMSLTRLELLLAAYVGGAGNAPAEDESPWRSQQVRSWFREVACAAEPALVPFSSAGTDTVRPSESRPPEPRCFAAGLARSETGLGLAFRRSLQAMARSGIHPEIVDLEQPRSSSVDLPSAAARSPLLRDITIVHINADAIPQALLQLGTSTILNSYKVGFLLWELEQIPFSHWLALDLLDEVWVPSRYLEQIYARHTLKPVVMMGAAVELPAAFTKADLTRLSVPEDAFKFFMSFDFRSSVERKNPWAAVCAFQKAFPAGALDVALVLKVTPRLQSEGDDRYEQWARVMGAAIQDPRIILIEEVLPFDQYIGLISACDCVVSPHRSEGFGFLPAYGLLLEKAVIATDYSGTTDFCTEETSYPVGWSPLKLSPGDFLYDAPDAFWAEIDIDHLASRMRQVFENPGEAKKRAVVGRELVESQYSGEAIAAGYRKRFVELGVLPR